MEKIKYLLLFGLLVLLPNISFAQTVNNFTKLTLLDKETDEVLYTGFKKSLVSLNPYDQTIEVVIQDVFGEVFDVVNLIEENTMTLFALKCTEHDNEIILVFYDDIVIIVSESIMYTIMLSN